MDKKNDNKDMYIKFQKGSRDGVSNNKGSCENLAKYLNHEDKEREEKGLKPLPFVTPDGQEVSTEKVIQAIDENAKGLGKNTTKFIHMVVAPSPEEIEAMGEDDQEVYRNALYYIKVISDAYARQFKRPGIEGSEDLEIYWRPHFFRGENGFLQFHIHGIISRMSKPVNGRKLKISPFTNHRGQTEGPIKGGFDRNEYSNLCEKYFDQLFEFERKLSKSFEYQNAMAHGTVEEKAAQADKQALETIDEMKQAIATNAAMRKAKAEEVTPAAEIKELKRDILQIFRREKNPRSLYLALAAIEVTCKFVMSADGVEDVRIEKGGTILSFREVMTPEEQTALLDEITRITGRQSAEKVREMRARNEMQKQVSQRKFGGPKLKR